MQDELNLVWKNYLLPPYKRSVAGRPAGPGRLKAKTFLACLALPAKSTEPALAATISGKIFSTDPYAARISATSQLLRPGIRRSAEPCDNSGFCRRPDKVHVLFLNDEW